jgi:hypothetical protein
MDNILDIIKFEKLIQSGNRDLLLPYRVVHEGEEIPLDNIRPDGVTTDSKTKNITVSNKYGGRVEGGKTKFYLLKMKLYNDETKVFSFLSVDKRDRYYRIIKRAKDVYHYVYQYIFKRVFEEIIYIDDEQNNKYIKDKDKRKPVEDLDEDIMSLLEDLFFSEDIEEDFNYEEILLDEAEEIIYNETQMGSKVLERFFDKAEEETTKTNIVDAMADLGFVQDREQFKDKISSDPNLEVALGNALGGSQHIMARNKISTVIVDAFHLDRTIKLIYLPKTESWLLRIFRTESDIPVSKVYGRHDGCDYKFDV